ncbi:PREDICTED: embryonic polyadenylate-binding protein 2 [Chrysochloris asiatica]|uniref:Embryonic polyadenylate-binding protein 2 n=1 Tax=Chrysochloris asiatica TaxID=185453 RepID=A0A9B0TH50_CHRAS|nr:PREDICTED: embryonic polyadenylate-binding protein 2 [Chrysochloris asiatica]
MWLFPSSSLFPPPTKAWLQKATSDPEAQGWGAWSGKPCLQPGPEKEEEEVEEDASLLLSLLERENLDEYQTGDQVPAESLAPSYCLGGVAEGELEAIRGILWVMEQAGELPGMSTVQGATPGQEGTSETQLVRRLLSHETGPLFLRSPQKTEADHRSVYVGNVDYGASAEELGAYFNPCGEIHRVTILCDKFSRHPKGYAYIEFTAASSAQAAVKLHESVFRQRVIKVCPKRTNFPGISSTDRGGLRGRLSAREGPFQRSLQGRPRSRAREANRGESTAMVPSPSRAQEGGPSVLPSSAQEASEGGSQWHSAACSPRVGMPTKASDFLQCVPLPLSPSLY